MPFPQLARAPLLAKVGVPLPAIQAAQMVDQLITGIDNPIVTIAAAPVFAGTAVAKLAASVVNAIASIFEGPPPAPFSDGTYFGSGGGRGGDSGAIREAL